VRLFEVNALVRCRVRGQQMPPYSFSLGPLKVATRLGQNCCGGLSIIVNNVSKQLKAQDLLPISIQLATSRFPALCEAALLCHNYGALALLRCRFQQAVPSLP
jgi:hypothetical protein